MSSVNNIVGNNIRKVRMARNMTQTDLAELIGRNQRTISNWEKGTRDAGSENIRLIADVLKVAPSELIGHNNAPSDNIFQVIVKDNDMSPEIQNGDTLTVSSSAKVKDGDIVIIKTGEETICRRIYTHSGLATFLALDPSIGMTVMENSEYEILGRVIEIRRTL